MTAPSMLFLYVAVAVTVGTGIALLLYLFLSDGPVFVRDQSVVYVDEDEDR